MTTCLPSGEGNRLSMRSLLSVKRVTFFDLTAKKVLAQEKAPMYIHELALNEKGDTIYAVGHKKIAVLSMGD